MYRTRVSCVDRKAFSAQHVAKVLFLEILQQSRKGKLEQKTKVRLPFVYLISRPKNPQPRNTFSLQWQLDVELSNENLIKN